MNWNYLRVRYIPCYWPLITYWTWPFEKEVGLKKEHITLQVWKKGDNWGIHEENSFNVASAHFFKRIHKNYQNLEEIRQNALDAGNAAITHCKEFVDHKTNDLKAFVLFFDELVLLYRDIVRTSIDYWFFATQKCEVEIDKNLENVSNEDKKRILDMMASPAEDSYSQNEEMVFFELVKSAKKKGIENVSKEIKAFSEKYIWFPYEYVGPNVWDEAAVRKRIQEELKQPSEHHFIPNLHELQEKVIIDYALSDELIKLFRILHALTLLQDDRKMINSQICYYTNHVVMKRLEKLIGIDYLLLRYLDQELLSTYIQNKDVDELNKKLEERQEISIISRKNGNLMILSGRAAEDYLNTRSVELYISDSTEITEVKGQIANMGKVTGIARVIKLSSNVRTFKKGDIIITGMTTPDFTPLIKKAGGIVTDEGGITCHAGIISRELNKPCVIGTKIATQVFKDGDKIEVDADKGIVRKIK